MPLIRPSVGMPSYICVMNTVFLPQLKGNAGGDVLGVFLQALPHVRSYAVDKGVLILKGHDGKVLLKLTDEGTVR